MSCPLCLEVLTDPVQVCKREHHFCRGCAHTLKALPLRDRKCPECRGKLSITDGQRFLRNAVEHLRVRCPNQAKGCSETPTRTTLDEHLADCPLQDVKCQHCSVTMERQLLRALHHHCDATRFGCDFVADTDEEVTVHLAGCVVSKCRKAFQALEQENAELRRSVIPPGAIIAWSGLKTKLPADWVFCDGEHGSPDFSGDFQTSAKKRRGNDGVVPEVHYTFAYIMRRADCVLEVSNAEENEGDQDFLAQAVTATVVESEESEEGQDEAEEEEEGE